MNRAPTHIRVLHTLDAFLRVSENWIYPQIFQVPGVESRVNCRTVQNLDTFSISWHDLIVPAPPWQIGYGLPRLLYALIKRAGLDEHYPEMRIRPWRPAIAHAHFGPCGYHAIPLAKRLEIPLITSFYGFDAWLLPESSPSWQLKYAQLFTAGDAFLVEGPAMRARLQQLGCPHHKIRVQRLGVNLRELTFEPKKHTDTLSVAMVGRFVEKKGFADGLRACAEACRRGANLRVTIVGDAVDGESSGPRIKEELRCVANRSELSGRVQFTGFLPVERTRQLLKEHHVFLCPSRRAANGDAEGGSPVVLTEAMALGLFCIGTHHCDIPQVIKHGGTGLLCDQGDISGIADALCSIERNYDGLADMVRNGRRHIEEHFSLHDQLRKMAGIYAGLLNKAPIATDDTERVIEVA